MKKIVVFGAGLSATYLISYLEENAEAHSWDLQIADRDHSLAKSKCKSSSTKCIEIDINDTSAVSKLISGSSLVVSMLPASLHIHIAEECLSQEIHMATASYLSEEMKSLDSQVKEKNLIFLNECGLDPGIDHLSAMKLLDGIRQEGGKIMEFESFTGGLIAV